MVLQQGLGFSRVFFAFIAGFRGWGLGFVCFTAGFRVYGFFVFKAGFRVWGFGFLVRVPLFLKQGLG